MRWVLVATCALLAVAVALYPLTLVEAEPYLVVPAIVGPPLLAAAAWSGVWPLASVGTILLIAEYALALIKLDAGIDAASVAMGVALLIELELVDLARLAARRATIRTAVILTRARFALGAGLAGGVAGGAALVAGALATGGNPVVFLVGAGAAAGAVWTAVVLAHRAVLDR
jgi:hypothetical protein